MNAWPFNGDYKRQTTTPKADVSVSKFIRSGKGKDLGLTEICNQPGSITIDPHPEASRAKQAKLTKVAG